MDYTTLGDILVVKDIIVCCPILRDISTLKIKSFNCNFSNNRKRLKMHSCTRMKEAKRLLLWLWVHVAALCNKIHLLLRCVAGFPDICSFSGRVLIAFCINYAALELQELRLWNYLLRGCRRKHMHGGLEKPFWHLPWWKAANWTSAEISASKCSIWSLWTPFTFFN